MFKKIKPLASAAFTCSEDDDTLDGPGLGGDAGDGTKDSDD